MAETQPLELSEERTSRIASAPAGPGLSKVLFRPSVVGAENIPLEDRSSSRDSPLQR